MIKWLVLKISEIRKKLNLFQFSEDAADGQVRFQGARFLLKLRRDEEKHLEMASDLCDALLVLDRSMASQKTRYFASSHGHRVKHRLWVGLIIIQVPQDAYHFSGF